MAVGILKADALDFLCITSLVPDLIHIDPPFNTGKEQTGYCGSYPDYRPHYISWLKSIAFRCKDILNTGGSFFLHTDRREAHYIKVMLDEVFGRTAFMNEIIWAYDYGGRSKTRWSPKHDTIFWYANDPKDYTFNYDAIDRIPYLAPGLVGPEKAAKGKTPTDVWWNTIVPTQGTERTGYPTQKPLAILERIVKVHSNPGDLVLDFFAGSGSMGEAAAKNDRDCFLVDVNPQAIKVMKRRLRKWL